ncbi:hypothetical protein EBZ38_16855, partial [bacterium]|nr:hypothetical protein [bacterium]
MAGHGPVTRGRTRMARTLSQGAGEDASRDQTELDLRVAAAIAAGNAAAAATGAGATQQATSAIIANPTALGAPPGGAAPVNPTQGAARGWTNVPASVYAPWPALGMRGATSAYPTGAAGAAAGGPTVTPGTTPAAPAISAASAGGSVLRGQRVTGQAPAPITGDQNRFSATGQPNVQFVKVTSAPNFRGTEYNTYNTWSHKFKAWAQLQGLWDYYLHEVSAPTPTGYTAAELASHVNALQMHHYALTRAYGELLQCLELDEHVQLLIEFQGIGTALPRPDLAWARLESVFTRSLPTSNIQVTKELARYKLQDGETIMDYWRRGKDIKTRHMAAHGPMSLQSWLTYVLAGLPSSWDAVSMIQTQLLPMQTEEGLLNILLEEEDRRRFKSKGKGIQDALNSETGGAGGKKGGKKTGKWGNKGKDYPSQKRIGQDGEWGE